MQKKWVFISSVQSEFAEERQMLFDYLTTDALLGKFFEPFIFEHVVAKSQTAQKVYFEQVEMCDIYIGILGQNYGNAGKDGISPTEKEYDTAVKLNKTRLSYLEDKEILRLFPFDATFDKRATLEDLDIKKIQKFVRIARAKRNFPFEEEGDFITVLWRKSQGTLVKATDKATDKMSKNQEKSGKNY